MISSGGDKPLLVVSVVLCSIALVLYKQRRFFVDNLMFGVQFANVSTRCSSHPQGVSEARGESASAL